jgi:hypothetical protein
MAPRLAPGSSTNRVKRPEMTGVLDQMDGSVSGGALTTATANL